MQHVGIVDSSVREQMRETFGEDHVWESQEAYQKALRLMHSEPLGMVRQFRKAMGQPLDLKIDAATQFENVPEDSLAYSFIEEEFWEFSEAWNEEDREGPESVLKELADLVYVAYGYAALRGWDLKTAVQRVHVSNMSKLDTEGKPIKNASGKVLKGPNYRAPDLKDLV